MARNKIGLYTAISLVIANMIGTGIFTSLGFQTPVLPSVSVLMLLWLCGGIIALCGGLSYIQLARLYPGSGGEYHYIRQVYPLFVAKLAGLISVLAGFSAPVALAAMAFSAYFSQMFPAADPKYTALVLVSVLTFVHCYSLKLGSRFQMLSTGLKVGLVVLFIIAGLWHDESHLKFSMTKSDGQSLLSPPFYSSLVYVSFAYSGWNACTYIFAEIKHPLKNIQRSVIFGTLTVTVLYLLLNLVFLKVIPMGEIGGVIEIGALAAAKIFGEAGGKIIAGMISLLLVSTLSAMIWVGPRVIDIIACELNVQWASSKVGDQVPLASIFIQYVITCLMLVTGTFEYIMAYSSILLNICASVSVFILFIDYKKQSRGSLLIAMIFIVANLWSSWFLIEAIIS